MIHIPMKVCMGKLLEYTLYTVQRCCEVIPDNRWSTRILGRNVTRWGERAVKCVNRNSQAFDIYNGVFVTVIRTAEVLRSLVQDYSKNTEMDYIDLRA